MFGQNVDQLQDLARLHQEDLLKEAAHFRLLHSGSERAPVLRFQSFAWDLGSTLVSLGQWLQTRSHPVTTECEC